MANGLPVGRLLEYVKRGIVTLEDLSNVGLPGVKMDYLTAAMANEEKAAWTRACSSGQVDDFIAYVVAYPQGQHIAQCQNVLQQNEESFYSQTMMVGTPEALARYLKVYEPLGGAHVAEISDMLNDPDWYQAMKENTITAYETYRQNHPGQRTVQLTEALERLYDERDWQLANGSGPNSWQQYVAKHPRGKYARVAQQRLELWKRRKEIIAQLPTMKAEDIKRALGNRLVSMDDVRRVFGDPSIVDAIMSFDGAIELPMCIPAEKLQADTTEVYFWGTPSTGKTCAIGALLSTAQKKGLLSKRQCQGRHYMDLLTNIFVADRIITLPESTYTNNLPEMVFDLREPANPQKEHPLTFVDIAGEVLKGFYCLQTGMQPTLEQTEAMNVVLPYLNNNRSHKIHFFVIEYGGHQSTYDVNGVDLNMTNFLDTCSEYMRDHGIFSRSSDAVYVLVTKCDKIPCAPQEIPDQAKHYINNYFVNFVMNLKAACDNAHIKDLNTISFSVGKVYAKQLCRFNESYTMKVIDKLILKTHARKGGLWRALNS